jgi:hypothetical protein
MDMKAIQIYALAVCFSSLMCFVVALGIAAYDVVEIGAPKTTSSQLAWYSTTERYLHYFPDKKSLPADKLEAARQMEYSLILDSAQQLAIQSLLFAGMILVIDAVVFAIHWQLAKEISRQPSPLPLGEG